MTDRQTPAPMVARCGHDDPLGFFGGTVCGPCARAAHRAATGKTARRNGGKR